MDHEHSNFDQHLNLAAYVVYVTSAELGALLDSKKLITTPGSSRQVEQR